MNSHWYQMTQDELFAKLKTDENGLTNKEANQRLEKYGPNTLPKKKARKKRQTITLTEK